MSREYFGSPGHFICADRCRFRLHTRVGKYRISTVGEYFISPGDTKPTDVGYERPYETMVFELGDDGEPVSWTEIDCKGHDTRDAANRGHELMVRDYEVIP